MSKMRWNDRQNCWQGTSGEAVVSLPDEKMKALIEQDLARYGSNPTEEERVAAAQRWLNVDRYATPIPGVDVTNAGRSGSIKPRWRGAKD